MDPLLSSAAATELISNPAPRSFRRRSSWPRAHRLVRRAHLYSGLFLAPWVLLYGFTGFLFNHPGVLADRERREFDLGQSMAWPWNDQPSPRELAEQLIASLRAAKKAPPSAFRLVESVPARYSSEFVFASAAGNGMQHNIRLNPSFGAGDVQSKVQSARPVEAEFTKGTQIPLGPRVVERFSQSISQVLVQFGLSSDRLVIQAVPEFTFALEAEGRVWKVVYNLRQGTLSARPIEEPSEPFSLRQLLVRLHLAHQYPSGFNARWVWAVFVDAMFVAMVFWVFSGLFMWYQVKSIRVAGGITLLASLAAATALTLGMHQLFMN